MVNPGGESFDGDTRSGVMLLDAPVAERQPFIEQFRPDETHASLLSVDFAAQVAAGRTTLVLDAESTFVEYDGWKVQQEIIDKLAEAREQGIERVVINTNKRPKDETDLWQLQWWTEQIDADLVIVPLNKEERKPSPHMLLQVMEHYHIEADSMLMIGDKLSSDIAAANAADVYSVKVGRLGFADHPGDRLGRRPAEKAFARFVINKSSLETDTVVSKRVYEVDMTTLKKDQRREIEVPEYIAKQGRIAGYGGPEITLSEDKLAQIPPRLSAAVTKQLKELGIKPGSQKFDEFMAEHGGLVADVVTYSRLGFGALTLYALARGHKKTAFVAYTAGQLTDVADGWASRKSNEDPNSERRKKMGRREANIDKAFSAMTGAGLVLNGTKSWKMFGAQQAREVTREPQRKYYDKQGLDTRSTRTSKNSTLGLAIADGASIILGPGPVSDALQVAATAGKYGSSVWSPREWRYKRDRKINGERVKEALTQKTV